MARYSFGLLYAQTPGSMMAFCRSTLNEMHASGYVSVPSPVPGGGSVPAIYFELGTWSVYRAVLIVASAGTEGQEHVWTIVLGSLGEDEDAPGRYFADSPGWNDAWSVATVPSAFGEFDYVEEAVATMALIHGIKTSILEEWGRCALRRTNLDGTDSSVTPTIHTYTRTSVWDALGDQIVDVDRCIVFDRRGGPGYDPLTDYIPTYVSAAATSPSGTTVFSEVGAGVVQALKDIAKRDIGIAMPRQGLFVSVKGSGVESE